MIVSCSNKAKADIWADTAKVSSMQDDSVKVDFILSLSEKLFDFDTELGIRYGKQGLELSKKLGFKSGIARAYKSFGINYWRMGVYDLAIENLFTSINYYFELKDEVAIGKNYNNIGLIYLARSDKSKALQYFNKGLVFAIKNNNLVEQSRLMHNMGLTEYELGNKDTSIALYRKSYDLAIKSNEQRLMAFNEVFLGKALGYFKKYDSAEYFLKLGIQRFNNLDAPNNVAMAYNQYAHLLIAMKKFDKAILYSKNADSLGKNIGNKYIQMEASKLIADSYQGLNDYKNALKWKDKHHALNDSMLNAANIKNISEQEAKFKYDQELREIKNQKERENLKNQMITLIMVLIIIVTLVFLYWKNKTNKKLTKQNEEINFLNEELKESNATKDKFFSIIAHDLKNPIGNFKNITQMMFDYFDELDKEEQMNYLKLLKESAESVSDLLMNLLEWSRTKRGLIHYNPQIFLLNNLFDNVVELLKLSASVKNIKIMIELEEEINLVADPNLLNTVLRNLVSNSIKYTKEGGLIEIGATHKDRNYLLYVKDNGVGINKENQEKLFGLDTNLTTEGTNQEKGTGLGLILCKEFIDLHKGKIWVESELGKGSTFFVAIPDNICQKVQAE